MKLASLPGGVTFGILFVNNSPIVGYTLCEKCLYLELFWSMFSRARTEYGTE